MSWERDNAVTLIPKGKVHILGLVDQDVGVFTRCGYNAGGCEPARRWAKVDQCRRCWGLVGPHRRVTA